MPIRSPDERRLRLAPEHGCWPLWDDWTGDNLDPRDLGLEPDLLERLLAWDDRFQATLDPAYPPDSRFPDAEAEAAWIAEGEALFRRLQARLGEQRVSRRVAGP